ncbi:amino acid adenylation domain-containing protein/non-ribosomal peptide synthase protein (TIGR01720 family) [Nitrobacter vulgaris]|uniref:non-ribosomal peptide synthetase n=1 Tax=Nitrobacter vulgaris TaxID=29421 RepID=UPI00285E625B|nr:non-ribosomal peptide synthetase [Nitrobacter vulgaris]MDR6305692.1 amino acid adenylation domain-containing protein/non-ribosomal peptide synthase protein (TIGR01720 family) [Nitrobacter vulgaris]
MYNDNLVERLREHVARRPDKAALRFLEQDDIVEELTFAELDVRIRSVAARLQQLGGVGERALILLPSGINYVVAFYACLYSGVVAVPAYPPEGSSERYAGRLSGILRDAAPRFILLESDLRSLVETAFPELTDVQVIAVDSVLTEPADEWRETRLAADAIAFLQYTSGSTSQPKGVCVSHANLAANERAMQSATGGTLDDVFVSWLPLYHDMGLIGGLLSPLFTGFTCVLMSPRNFLERPRRWLEAIDRHGGTISGGPDFAYALCTDRVSDETIDRLNLSRWKFAFSGSEFVRHTTLQRFGDRFARAGFDRRALNACYGLAEATLLVTASDITAETISYTLDTAKLAAGLVACADKGTDLVACGRPAADHATRIMRVDGSVAAGADEVGEIWVSGPSVTLGYWNNPDATRQVFVERDGFRWLRTGDLGFIRDGALVVAGRLKDVLIVRGQNVYPTDVEQAVEADVNSVRRGRVAAFAVEAEGREGIGVAAEFSRAVLKSENPEALADAIGQAVLRQAQEYPAVIVLLNPRAMPLTTSGKLQRSACAARLANDTIDSFMVFEKGRRRDSTTLTPPVTDTERAVSLIWCDALGLRAVHCEDDFFFLGGNSITVGQVASEIRERFGLELELRSFFDAPTLAAFASHIDSLARTGVRPPLPSILKAAAADRATLSHAQERLWFLWNMDPVGTAYTVASAIRLKGGLDHAALTGAIDQIVCRHEALRTTFVAIEGRATQVVHDSMDVDIKHEDLRAYPANARDAHAAEIRRSELAKPFDLANGPLLRTVLLQLADDAHELLLLAHHIIVDGWSLDVLLQELSSLYRGALGQKADLPPVPAVQYADFAIWQRNWLAEGEGDRQLRYWRTKLGDEHPVLALPHDRPRPVTQSHGGDTVGFAIDGGLAARLQKIAAEHRVSVFMLILAAYQALLYRYCGQSDLRIGVPIAGRQQAQLERLIGCFVNTLVLRAEIVDDASFTSFLQQVKETVIEALSHQDLPFEMLVDGLRPERNGSHNPLFQAKFNYMTASRGFDGVDGLTADIEIMDLAGSHFDLALDVVDSLSGMKATFNYATDLFDRPTIERFAAQFCLMLRQIIDDAERRISDFVIDDASRQVVATQSATFEFNDVVSLHRASTLGKRAVVAVRYGDETLTFADLEQRSNRIANMLIARGVTREVAVALWMERTPSFVVALLGVLKAGASYVPLDPKWPLERIKRILNDGPIEVLLATAEKLSESHALDCVVIDANAEATNEAISDGPPETVIHPAQTAYVIYTSGSTGTPKGVAVSHGALANYVQALLQRLQPQSSASMAMVSTVAADLGHTVLFGALASGTTLNLLSSEAVLDADAFARAMEEGKVGVLKIVPSHLRGLLQARRSADLLPCETLILGGEACDAALLDEVRRLRPHCRIINHYGPTEATVGAAIHECGSEHKNGSVPIGLPLANLRVHVLDNALNEVPIGVAGELYIGGAGVARGYRGSAGLTAERFVPDPFGAAGDRLYRTGDRVRCDQAGRLIFIGRNDDQIKLRGYRIEPDEVGRAIKALPGINDAVVIVRSIDAKVGRQELVAYCVPGDGMTLEAEAIKRQLSAFVPDYMVPSHIVVLERLPLTPNGKIDRKALPESAGGVAASNYVAPAGGTETTIAAVWCEVIGRERVGRNDNFFELGGDSILSLQIVARLRKRGIRLTPKQIFSQQTIAGLAAVAILTTASAPEKERSGSRTGSDPAPCMSHLLPIQTRFFTEEIENRNHWNQAVLLIPQGRMDWEILRRALIAVVEHHDALRLRFKQVDGGWRAEKDVSPAPSDLLWTHAGVGDAIQVTALASAAQKSLSLSSGPLLRAVGMDLADGSQRLLLAIHHLVVDGVSWRILLEDLASAYEQMEKGGALELAPKSDSYASWGERLHTYAATAEVASELPVWLDCEANSNLPCDGNHGGVDLVGDSAEVSLVLDPEFTSRLLEEAPAAYRTQVNDLMLAGLARAVSRWSGCDDVTVELEGHGREDIFPGADVSRTVGWFTTAFPVRLQGGGDDASLIKAVKEKLRDIPNHGLGYGVLRYLGSEEQRCVLKRMAEPQIVFNYLGRFDGSVGTSSRFSFAPENTGPSRCASGPMRGWLVINGLVRDGRLRLSLEYGRKRFQRATIERLAELYETALRELVTHCCSGAFGLTPSDVALSGLRQSDLDRFALDARNIQDIYPLSPMQQGMLFHALRDGGNDAYVNQIGIELLGFDAGKLRMAWQAVSDRHAALRTGFVWQDLSGATQQVVYRHVAVPFVEEDWRQRAAVLERGDKRAELETALAEISRQEYEKGFDLAQAPLQRVRLIHLDEKRHWLIWTHHHILADGWSSARLVAEVLQHVREGALPTAQGSYRDYIAWLQDRDSASAEKFWRDTLAELETPTLLANTMVTNKASEARGHASTVLTMNAELTWSLKSLAKRERVTLNTVIQAAWAQLLRRLSGQFAVCFGVTVSGRPEELHGSEETVGLFINTLPIVDAPSPQTKVGDWLRRLQEQNLVLREHGWTPLYEIQRFAGHGGQTLFDNILVFENYPIDEGLQQAGGSGPRLGRVDHVTPTNFALAVAVFAGNDRLNLEFNYDLARFDEASIQRLRDMLRGLLEQIAFDAGSPLGRLGSAVSDEARVFNWSNAAQLASPASSIGVVAHIEAQAARARSSVAVIWRDRRLSYGELNTRANQLAKQLRGQGIGPDCLVGIALARSPEMMVALLAVLKAGAAYLPLDPDYPAERLVHMLRDSGTQLILTESDQLKSLSSVLDQIAVETFCIDRPSLFAGEDAGNLNIEIHPDSLAYVIYTSGSTGTPKGVAVAHGPLAMHCEAISRLYRMTSRDREFQTASINFDIAHERWLVPLMSGGSLVLPSRPGLLVDDLVHEIERSSVTTIFLPPAYADQLSAALRQSGRKLSIRACIVGGEAWLDTGIKAVREVIDTDLLINAYGPTETVIAPTAWVVDDAKLKPRQAASIGRPVGARTAYILDSDLNVIPAGVTGELFIGGAGLARGYLNRSAMTAERFIPDPFGASGDRLYRTGDLARWRDDGVIDYVGRADQQVKIRGFRIELGEIEARLIEQRGVRAAALVARESKTGRHLVAYVSGDAALDGAALRDALAAVLPDYMVPATIVVLEKLPLTLNGKIDRQALPAPHEDMLACRRYEAPEDDVEIALARIWSEILGVERVGRNDHFFELGGHSLLAVRVLSLVSQEIGVSIPISDLFAHPDLASFARVVSIRLIEQEFDAEELRELIAAEQ